MAIQEVEMARLHSIMFSPADDSHDNSYTGGGGEITSASASTAGNNDEEPSWFKQVNTLVRRV